MPTRYSVKVPSAITVKKDDAIEHEYLRNHVEKKGFKPNASKKKANEEATKLFKDIMSHDKDHWVL